MQRTIYLAGPISGQTYDEATNGWRLKFDNLLQGMCELSNGLDEVTCASPMRGKDFLAERTEPLGHCPDELVGYGNPMVSPSGIVTRDAYDVRTSDAILVNLLYADRVSIGTTLEVGMAFAWRVPIILVIPNRRGHPHDHGMLLSMAQANGYSTHSLEQAAELAFHLLVPTL
jgi:hypothetical protein